MFNDDKTLTNSTAKLSQGAMNALKLFFVVFPLKFLHIDQTYIALKYFYKTNLQKTLFNMQVVKKEGAKDSLCKSSNARCFRTTNFDGFHYGVSV